jgi:hypothetical protein
MTKLRQRPVKLKPYELATTSTANLLFSFNLRELFGYLNIQSAYERVQIFSTQPNDFPMLTTHNILCVLQSHFICLNAAIKRYNSQIQRQPMESDIHLGAIRKFIGTTRKALGHLEKSFGKFSWDKTFKFEFLIPAESVQPGQYKYSPTSKKNKKIKIQGTEGHEVRVNNKMIFKIIMLSFHLIHILKFRKETTCNQFLSKFKSTFR